jgi:Helix-loop-helix DNA-binding domain
MVTNNLILCSIDFKFSIGLDPDFSIPIPLETPPPPPVMDMATDFPTADNFLQQNANPLLDENDQRAFTQFLDSFFVEQDSSAAEDHHHQQIIPSLFDQQQHSDSHDQPPPSSHFTNNTSSSSWNYNYETPGVLLNHDRPSSDCHDPDQHRRSIIDSLDASHQQRFYQQISSMVVPVKSETESDHTLIQDGTNSNSNNQQRGRRKQSVKRRASETDSDEDDDMAESPGSSTSGNKRSKQHKELLTEEEKRANHIASEQKRRNTIRTGFKELTDIIPTLKNINNSKSTILFKAVEYIRYLERRNRGLRDRVGGLEVRVEVEGRMGNLMNHSHLNGRRNTMSNFMNLRANDNNGNPNLSPERSRTTSHSGSFSTFANTQKPASNQDSEMMTSRFVDNTSGLPPAAAAALLAHKSQQKQLQAFQEQLQLHQRLIAQKSKDNGAKEKSFLDERRQSLPTFASNTTLSPSRSNYDSISIPISDTANASNSMALVMPVDEQQEWRETDRHKDAINIPVDHDHHHKDQTMDERSMTRTSDMRSPEKPTSDLINSLKHGIATTTAVAASSS